MTLVVSSDGASVVVKDDSTGDIQLFPAATIVSYGADPGQAIAAVLGVTVDQIPGVDDAIAVLSGAMAEHQQSARSLAVQDAEQILAGFEGAQ